MKNILNRIFVDGLSGMVLGIFSTLTLGTIFRQIGTLLGGSIGNQLYLIGTIGIGLTGAGIGCGVAYKLKEDTLVVVAAAVAGMVGSYSGEILGSGTLRFSGSKDLLVAFLAAFVGIEVGHFLSGKTKLDILVVPIPSILVGSFVGLFVAPFSAKATGFIVNLIHWGTLQHPLLMGVVVAVLMGMLTTLPFHMVAFGVLLSLSGKAAGAATIGCCASMVGFAVASYKDNGVGGLFAQGLGSSVLQFPNIIKKPIIWMPSILTSAILGPLGTLKWVNMTNTQTGAVMGSCGLVGQIMTYHNMISSNEMMLLILKIAGFHFVLPGILSFGIVEFMRRIKWIKNGDMKINV